MSAYELLTEQSRLLSQQKALRGPPHSVISAEIEAINKRLRQLNARTPSTL